MVQNAVVTKLKTKVISSRTEKVQTLEEYIEQRKVQIQELLPPNMTIDRFLRIAYTSFRLNPKLADCTPQSIMGALLQSAQLALEPNTEGQAYIVPYTNTKYINGKKTFVLEAQFQIGYKGYIELFYRHSAAQVIDMHTVYEHDKFEYAYGTQPYLKHCPVLKDRGEVIAYYAVAILNNGGSVFKVMSKDECIEHGKTHSKCYITRKWDDNAKTYIEVTPHFDPNSPWAKEVNAMCKKTVLNQLAKLLPKSVELQKALAMDNTTKSDIKADMFEVQDETNWDCENKLLAATPTHAAEESLNSALLPQSEAGG